MSPRGVAGVACILALATGALGCSVMGGSLNPKPASITASGMWTDDDGKPLAFEQFRGTPVVVSAVYTSCTVRCPMTVNKLRDVEAAYRKAGSSVPFVILTLDPQTDTIERLHRFKQERNLPDSWHFIRGSLADTRALARSLQVHAAWDDAHIDHDVQIAVFDAKGHLAHGFSGWSFDPQAAVVR